MAARLKSDTEDRITARWLRPDTRILINLNFLKYRCPWRFGFLNWQGLGFRFQFQIVNKVNSHCLSCFDLCLCRFSLLISARPALTDLQANNSQIDMEEK